MSNKGSIIYNGNIIKIDNKRKKTDRKDYLVFDVFPSLTLERW